VRTFNHSAYVLRKSFSDINDDHIIPHLISLQKESYEKFLQIEDSSLRRSIGLQRIFESFFPLIDTSKTVSLDFVGYLLGKSKYTSKECLISGRTYSAPLTAKLRFIVWDKTDTEVKNIKVIKEQEVYLCNIPLMTENGSFIINGAERVVVSQMRRAPGIFFDSEDSKVIGSKIYKAKIVPISGSWLDFEFDIKDNLHFRIDRKRKMPITTLLRASNLSVSEIIKTFYKEIEITYHKKGWVVDFDYERAIGRRYEHDIIDVNTNKVCVTKDTRITKKFLQKLKESGFKKYFLNENLIPGYATSEDLIDKKTGEVLLNAGSVLSLDKLDVLKRLNFEKIKVVNPEYSDIGPYIFNTLLIDKNTTQEDVLCDIYKAVRVSEIPSSQEQAEKFFHNLLFGSRYNLSDVGRMKMNHRLDLSIPLNTHHLTKEDIVATITTLCRMKHNEEKTDDIDSLANRRVRAVGELVENQFRIGMARIERSILEKMNNVDIESVMPQNLINSKPLISAINDFFATSQLSQFMDQTNPLSEITHKRRLSALGPGGLTRERAGFEVRDLHPTHYGRICPAETPEGQNIGLINSLALYARVNEYGFIETPYRKVEKGKILSEICYLSALEERGHVIAQANIEVDDKGKITAELANCRKDGEYIMLPPESIDFIDVSTRQVVSVATNLLPFLENDDAKRTLMGANMMRQAVPLLRSESPLVGTGMEKVVAVDSGCVLTAKNSGVVKFVDSSRIVVEISVEKSISKTNVYDLIKYNRTNHDTTINQKPIVTVGQSIEKGEIIADAQSIDCGELSLGRNALVAFMPWDGYNYEDSILISERLVRDNVFTSIHIEEFEVVARDTRLGPEEITRDIPNVGEEALKKLDENGIIHIGANIKTGDILVGKTTPKSESPTTPEEKLLKVIFGEKAMDVKDSSLYVSSGIMSGTVIDVKIFTRVGLEKDERASFIEIKDIERASKEKDLKLGIIRNSFYENVRTIIVNTKLEKHDVENVKKNTKLTAKIVKDIPGHLLSKIVVDNQKVMDKIEELKTLLLQAIDEADKDFNEKIIKIKEGDELGQGVLKMVKVLVATKQLLQAGDKMAGRHGNKGVISRVLPMEDLPYMEDGTPVDIVLNPLGVPSRMNIGQILEVHLGWASVNLGKQISEIVGNVQRDKKVYFEELKKKILSIYSKKRETEKVLAMNDEELIEFAKKLKKGVPFATGIFESIKIKDIEKIMEDSGIDKTGQVILTDGRSGEKFDRPVTVGYMYMLKLHHLVDSKIHARSIGPYSLITQQPLGGKSHFGGQRFGEMECWALQAYGAAFTLQEMLTVKSDDVVGRVKIYESIVQGNQNFSCGISESFNVMVKEVRSLGLNIELISE